MNEHVNREDDTPTEIRAETPDERRERLAAFGLQPPPDDDDAPGPEIDPGHDGHDDEVQEPWPDHELGQEPEPDLETEPWFDPRGDPEVVRRPIIPIDVLVPIVVLGLLIVVLASWLR